MFRQMLLGSTRAVYAPETDEGADDFEDEIIEDEAAEDEIEDEEADLEEDLEGDEQEEVQPPKKARETGRLATLAAERAAERARADAAERRLAEIEARNGQQSDAERRRQRDEHLATLTGDQRTEFLLREQGQKTEAELARIRFESFDASDKAKFDALVARTPALRGMDAEIETALATMRAQGTNAPRETVAAYLLGQKALAKQTRSNNAGKKRADAGRERQVVNPSSGRSDVAPNRRRVGSTPAERLRGVKI